MSQQQRPSPYVNPLAHATGIFDSSPIKMDTSMVSNMGGGGGGVYHGFDGNRAGYDLSAYQGAYVPQHSGNHAMQRLDPCSQQQQGGRQRRRRTVQKKSLNRKNKNNNRFTRKYKHKTKRRYYCKKLI